VRDRRAAGRRASGAAARAGRGVVDPLFLEGGQGGLADHAAVGDETEPAEPEALAQAAQEGCQHGDVGGVARKHLGAERSPVLVHGDREDHLGELGPMILGVAVPTEACPAAAVEGERGGVDEDHRELAEEIAAAGEQAFLDQVLGGSGREPAPSWSASSSPSQAMAR
jgi:hypothetical protein